MEFWDNEMTPKELSDALEALKWSGADLGRRVGVGVPQVSRWRHGKARIPLSVSAYICLVLRVKSVLDWRRE